jgi:hypothetical protein
MLNPSERADDYHGIGTYERVCVALHANVCMCVSRCVCVLHSETCFDVDNSHMPTIVYVRSKAQIA